MSERIVAATPERQSVLVRTRKGYGYIANTVDKVRWREQPLYEIMRFAEFEPADNDKDLLEEIQSYTTRPANKQ